MSQLGDASGTATLHLTALRRALFIANMSERNVAYDCVAWSSGLHTTKQGAWRMVRSARGQSSLDGAALPKAKPAAGEHTID